MICYHLLLLLLGSPDDLRSPLVPLVEVIALCELACWVANCWKKMPPLEPEQSLSDVRHSGCYENRQGTIASPLRFPFEMSAHLYQYVHLGEAFEASVL